MNIDFPILGATLPQASHIAGIGQTKLKELIRNGDIETFVVGCRRLVYVPSLQAYIESRRGQQGDPRRNNTVAKAGGRRPRKTAAADPAIVRSVP